jgi:hypothetical protein
MGTLTTTEITTSNITHNEIALFLREHEDLARMRLEAASLSRALARREASIISRLQKGAHQPGNLIVVTRRRQNISWLTMFRRELGIAAVLAVKNEWPVTFYDELQIVV